MKRGSLNPFHEMALLIWLWRLLRDEKADVVHSFTIKGVVYGGLAARCAGAARVNAVTGMGYVFISDELLMRMLRPILWALLRPALGGVRTRFILQNIDDIALFQETGIASPTRIRLIPGSGVDCLRFLPPVETERGDPLLVVLPARMLWNKGVREFVEAARTLKLQGRRLRFQLAGGPDPGHPASIPESVLLDWEAAGLISWLGHVDNMPALLASADIVVLPSYREGLPKSLIEAAACARPLVTTDAPGCRDVVTDGVDGLLVPVRNVSALAQAIARLQDDPSLARRLGEAARTKALAEYDERRIIARTLDVYHEVLSEPPTGTHLPPERPAPDRFGPPS
jgi:glycosyltransferase involved in cell wall biosynthesis